MAELLGCPNGPDTFTITRENMLVDHQLDLFWGSITGNDHPESDLMHSDNIYNSVIRYFHKILAHTLFGKEQNRTFVSKDELFIMYYASQARPVNTATFMIANLLNPLGGIRPMNIDFCFNTNIIRNLGPDVFEFLINSQVVHMFTLPDHRTSVHDMKNWIYDLDEPPDAPPSPPETPQIYDHYDNYLSDAESHASVIPVAPLTDHAAAIEAVQTDVANLRGELSILRMEFHDFVDVVTKNLDHIYQHFYSFAPLASSRRNG
ncbi:hypothetical protein KIW84_070701 [Lathyrus oleraceus]|uniref:Arabidopsis retrotransposon Orf1 C-terminal domain-containing protein n=1 Tax=Pisum sativum TaxID=3888 RepID=A0A9D4ZTX5_PEA|nr:hypothetical protein KIW84_070701 [Pisum sativum]